MTLAQLRALLKRALHADAPTPPHIARLGPTVTVEDLARAYLPYAVRVRCIIPAAGRRLAREYVQTAALTAWLADPGAEGMDLTDPGTVNAVKVALALALGLDPGPMGCAVSWRYGAWGWVLRGAGSSYIMSATTEEPDAIKALVLAVEHVLGAS